MKIALIGKIRVIKIIDSEIKIGALNLEYLDKKTLSGIDFYNLFISNILENGINKVSIKLYIEPRCRIRRVIITMAKFTFLSTEPIRNKDRANKI